MRIKALVGQERELVGLVVQFQGQHKKDVELLEQVQRRATMMIRELEL